METKHGYDKAKKSMSKNMSDYSPNAGENQVHFSEGMYAYGGLSAGVVDGLAHVSPMDVKNAETVSDNQRPDGRRESAGDSFVIGV